jgi:hypothetical protein
MASYVQGSGGSGGTSKRGYLSVSHDQSLSAAAAAAAPTTEPRPYSALMASLFSPEQTPSQTACAEAAASVMAGFSVPGTFEPTFYNQPDPQSVLVHSVSSTDKTSGFQAILVLHPKSSLPSHLGLPQGSSSSSSSSSSSTSEETAYLMSAPKNQPFLAYNQAPKALVMQVTIPEYLTLLTFWNTEWSRVQSKLAYQAGLMRTGQDLIPISSTLAFYHHGCSHYSVHLSSRLMLKAKVDSKSSSSSSSSSSKDDKDKDKSSVRAWLELKTPSGSGSGGGSAGGSSSDWITHVFSLPVEALTELSRDQGTCNTLTNLFAGYKSRSRKRSKPVA